MIDLEDVRKHHEHTELEIQNNFGAAYSSRITDSYQIHQDRAFLLQECDRLGRERDDLSGKLDITAIQRDEAVAQLAKANALIDLMDMDKNRDEQDRT